MIDRVLKDITKKLNGELGEEVEIKLENPNKLSDGGLFIFLLSVSEEASLKNIDRVVKKEGKTKYREPSVYLNLQVVLAFNLFDYETGLKHLSNTVRYFQKNKTISIDNDNSTHQIKIIVELQDVNIEQLNQIWSIAGGVLYPSLLYRIRVIEIAVNEIHDAPEIEKIQMDFNKIN